MMKTVFSGMRPTGRLHLGHLVGALQNWVSLQNAHRCIFSIVDWHAYMGDYEDTARMRSHILDMAIDWMACGVDPEKSIVFVQSDVSEHLELFMIFSCLTPLGWLERNPTYKDQLREIQTRDLHTYGFLGYPVLQAADILLYKAQAVPIGEDQLPHIELTREIARKFNYLYKKEVFKDCEAILTPVARLLGLDGRKMSKSYDNAIHLSDSVEVIESKIASMITDPQRIRLKDPGHPQVCNVFSYYQVFAASLAPDVCTWCTQAQKGCTECKKILAKEIMTQLQPIQHRRQAIAADPDRVWAILARGAEQAKAVAKSTIQEVRQLLF